MSSPTIPVPGTQAAAVGTGLAGAALTLSKPGGVTNGDLLLMCIAAYDFANLTLPSGFTAIINATNGTNARRLIVAAKPITDSTSEPASYSTNTSTSNTATIAGRLYRVAGGNQNTPAENAVTANSTLNGPDIVSSGDERFGLVFYAGEWSSNAIVPTEVSLVSQAASTTGPDSEPNSRIAIGYKTDLGPGTTVVGNWTGGTQAGGCIVGALCLLPADPVVAGRNLTLLGVG